MLKLEIYKFENKKKKSLIIQGRAISIVIL